MDRHHDPDKRETHAESCENRVHLQLPLVLGTPDKRHQKGLVDHPVAEKGQRRNDEHRQDRADGISHENPERGQRAEHQELAIG